MDSQIPIIRKKSNLIEKTQEKEIAIPPMICCDQLITNLKKITLMDILDQFAKDSESKSIVEILRSIFEISKKPQRVQDQIQTDPQSVNNYKDNQKFEFNDEQNKKNRQNGYDSQNTKQKDYRYRDQERGRDQGKNQYNERHDNYDRYEKHDRNERRHKHDNKERNDRYDRNDQYDKYSKYDKKDNYDRRDKNDRYGYENRGRRDYNKNEYQNETQIMNNDWAIKIPETVINGSQTNGNADNSNLPNLLSITTPK